MKKIILSVLALLLCCVFTNAANVYVDNTVSTTLINPGQTWGNAYSKLEDALAAASSGDVIRISTGTYTPPSGARYVLKDGVQVLGGHRAAIPNSTLPDFFRNGSRNSNLYPVTLVSSSLHSVITANTTITTSTIVNGVVFGGSRDGLEITDNPFVFSAHFVNCKFEGGQYGVHIHDSENDFTPTFTNCEFTSHLGGVYLQAHTGNNIGVKVSPTFKQCKFYGMEHGVALKAAVGVFTPHFEKCSFHNIFGYVFTNLGFEDGYGIGAGYMASGCPSVTDFNYNPTIENSIFYDNGGVLDALVSFSCPANEVATKFTNCTFYHNNGGMRSSFSLRNFSNNPSNTLSIVGLELENCISYNNVNSAGRLIELGKSMKAEIRNSMIEALSSNSNGIMSDAAFYLYFPHNTIDQVIDLGGNVYHQDPKFVNSALSPVPNLDLLATSPARNTGYVALLPSPGPIGPVETDYEGKIRVNENIIDMGAYEYCASQNGCYPVMQSQIRLAQHVELEESIITVSPNPFYDMLNISKNSNSNAQVTIYSITGDLVFEGSFESYDTTIDLSGYPNGVYVVTVRDAASSTTQRVMKK